MPMTTSEHEKKSIEEAFDDYRTGRIDDIELRERCGRDEEALRRLAHVYRDDERIVAGEEMCAITLFEALRNGCEEAGWEILEAPERTTEDIGSPINPRRRAVLEMTQRRVEGVGGSGRRICNIFPDEEAVAEMERRSKDHPEIAAAIACSDLGGWLDEYADWTALAGSAFRPQVTYAAAMRRIRGHDPAGGLPALRESASLGNSKALLKLGELEFLGYGLPRSLSDARAHIGMAAEDGLRDAFAWISLFNDLPLVRTPRTVSGGREPRLHGRGRHPYRLSSGMRKLTEIDVLSDIARMDPCGYAGEGGIRMESGSIINGTFLFRPLRTAIRRTSDAALKETPNFCFLPTGFEMVWENDGTIRHINMNRDVDAMDVKRILRLCIQSVLDDIDGGTAR